MHLNNVVQFFDCKRLLIKSQALKIRANAFKSGMNFDFYEFSMLKILNFAKPRK